MPAERSDENVPNPHGHRFVRIAARLTKDADGYPPVDVEHLWAFASGVQGVYVLDSIPWYARDVSVGDRVAVQQSDGQLELVGLVEAQGHATLRVLLTSPGDVQQVRGRLASLGCATELSNVPGFFSVDVPPEVSSEQVEGYLEQLADAGLADYEISVARGK